MQVERFKTRHAYWGAADYFRGSTGLALKQIYMKGGTQSSMEYHVHKREIYWVTMGELRLGLRDGRGDNRSIILKEGDCYEIEPGQMHMRIALTDVCILEACSVDTDDDTHIVFDGKTYRFTEDVPNEAVS